MALKVNSYPLKYCWSFRLAKCLLQLLLFLSFILIRCDSDDVKGFLMEENSTRTGLTNRIQVCWSDHHRNSVIQKHQKKKKNLNRKKN